MHLIQVCGLAVKSDFYVRNAQLFNIYDFFINDQKHKFNSFCPISSYDSIHSLRIHCGNWIHWIHWELSRGGDRPDPDHAGCCCAAEAATALSGIPSALHLHLLNKMSGVGLSRSDDTIVRYLHWSQNCRSHLISLHFRSGRWGWMGPWNMKLISPCTVYDDCHVICQQV